MMLELLWSTLRNCWQWCGHLGVIFWGLRGYLRLPREYLGSCWGYGGLSCGLLGHRHQSIHQTKKTHDSLNCVNRSRSAPFERECNFKKQRCHRTSHSHTSFKTLNPFRSTPVERKHTNPKPYTQQCSSHIEKHIPD